MSVLSDTDRKQYLGMLQGVLNQDPSAVLELADRLTELGNAQLLVSILNRLSWVQMPHPAHFIGSRDCHFWLATWIPNTSKRKRPKKACGYIISTIGEYWPLPTGNRDMFDWIEVSSGALYETMVFHGAKAISPCKCCPYYLLNHRELGVERYNDSGNATEGHWRMCERWAGL